MKKLYFIRHGLTQANVDGIFSGHLETPLVEQGRQQAKATGQKLKKIGADIDLIIASPSSRAYETAAIIAKEINYPVQKIIKNDLFKERYFGELEGSSGAEFYNAHIYKDIDEIPGAENIEELQNRAEEALAYIKTMEADNILVVAHGAFGRAFRRIVAGHPHTHEYTNPFIAIKNGEIVELI